MSENTPQDLLREAAHLVREALAQLDISETICDGCHGRKFNNFMHGKVHSRLYGTPAKLVESAIFLDAKDEGTAEQAIAHQRAEAARLDAARLAEKTGALTSHQLARAAHPKQRG